VDRLWKMGVLSHLFSFFSEKDSQCAERPQPLWSTYLRIQLARYVIEEGLGTFPSMSFDSKGHLTDFGIDSQKLGEIIERGVPFMTTGCLGDDGKVACNRPFGNCLPEVKQWNYPYLPNREEKDLILRDIWIKNRGSSG